MSRPKIALLHESSWFIGGGQRFAYLIARELGIPVYTCGLIESIGEYLPGCTFVDVGTKTKKSHGWSALFADWLTADLPDCDFYLISGSAPLLRLLVDKKPYLFYCHSPPRKFKDTLPLLINETKKGAIPLGWMRRFKSIDNRLLGLKLWAEAYRAADYVFMRSLVDAKRVVTNSHLTYGRYRDYYGVYPRGVIYPPIDVKKYKNEPSEGYFLTVNRLESIKRIDWQIDAFRKSGAALKIVGTGADEEALKKRAAGARNIEFLGAVDEKTLLDLYAHCTAFVFTAKNEDFGLTPLEALASGKPVVSVREGGLWEYLNERNSFGFANPDELALILSSKSPADFDSMREECLKTAQNFDVSVIAPHVLKLIEVLG